MGGPTFHNSGGTMNTVDGVRCLHLCVRQACEGSALMMFSYAHVAATRHCYSEVTTRGSIDTRESTAINQPTARRVQPLQHQTVQKTGHKRTGRNQLTSTSAVPSSTMSASGSSETTAASAAMIWPSRLAFALFCAKMASSTAATRTFASGVSE